MSSRGGFGLNGEAGKPLNNGMLIQNELQTSGEFLTLPEKRSPKIKVAEDLTSSNQRNIEITTLGDKSHFKTTPLETVSEAVTPVATKTP